ncbi:kinetochore-associated protein 1 [Anopheles ziemanni]|uniref:kinetochore-associated protein 1 n=1 Tax=Anopheles coustani TaxID=139045 RepID=UPI002659CB6C|nr:kinetochore-associated protein 1 [Anopheles coustani]XP_058171160.1 kinetochore-associated protein 1 [Anopheles ziemanni]
MWSCVEPVSSIDESIVGVFCTNGLLRISSQQTITRAPTVNGILQNNRLVISVDSAIILFQDEKRCNEASILDVEYSVETITVSASGNIIVCGLSNGTIFGLHITGVKLFEFAIEPTDRGTDCASFAGICDTGNGRFLVQTTRGTLYRVALDESMVEESIDAVSNPDQLADVAKYERLIGKKFEDRIVCFIALRHYHLGKQSSVPLIAAANSDTIFFYREEKAEQVQLKPEYKGVKKMFTLMNCVFALTNNGQLFEICPLTKLMSELPCTFRIDDIVTLQATADVIEMLITTKADANGKKLMKIVNFPTMEIKQEMEMTEHTWLLQQPKNSANIYYIAGQTYKEPVVQEIELKILSETDPSLRLLKLLKIGRLDEAEVFAKQFDLDLQLVHKTRAKLLLDELSTAGNEETIFGKLMQVLAAVDDTDYLTSIRRASIGDRNMKKRFLQFLLSKVSTGGNAEMDPVIDINERVLRIETLQLIDPFDIDQDWQQFVYHDNLPQLCTELFPKDMDAACLIWSRHFASILPQLDDAKVTALLRAIPKETSPLHVIQWLLHFVSPVLHHLPQLMNQLVQFIVGRAKSFQKLPGWPMIGLTFIEDAIKILQEVNFPLIDLRLQFDSNMEELQRLAAALRDLVTLKQQFNLLASLDCYMQEDMESTAFRLLQITPLNLLARIVTEFLYKFFVGQEVKLFQQIERYIQFLVANQYNSFWDQRCITLVELLYDEQQQLEMILTILRAAPVPWSSTVASLLKYATGGHPTAKEILIEQKSQILKCLKIKYGWSLKAPCNARLLVQRVLKVHLPEMLGDIRAIVKASPELAFTTDLSVLAKLAEYGDILAAAEYLDGLEKSRKEQCCRGSIAMMIRMVDGGKISKDLAMAYLEALQMLKHRAEPLQQKSIQQIVNIVQLRTEFGLSVTCQSFNDASERSALLQAGIRFVLSKIKDNREQFLDLLLGASRRLSSLLRYNLLDCLHEVMLLLDNVHMSCLLAAQLPEMSDLRQPDAFTPVHRIVSLLLAQQMRLLHDSGCSGWVEDPLTFPICRELLYRTTGGCPAQTAIRFELLRWIQIGVRYYPSGIEFESHRRTIVPEPVFSSMYERLSKETIVSMNGKSPPTNGHSKRESLSTFDVVNDDFDQVTVPRNRHVQEQETIVKCVGLAMQVLLCRVRDAKPSQTFVHLLQRMEPMDEVLISNEFQTTLDHLIRAKQYPPVVNVVHLLMSYKPAIGLLVPMNYAENVYRKSIKYMLSQKDPNYSSAIMTLFTCEQRDMCLDYLRTQLTNESQRVSLHTLLEFYYFTLGQEEKAVEERRQRLRYTLFHELCKLDPALKTKKAFVFHSQADLMKELTHKLIGVELLRKMSDAFSWDYQQMVVSQIVTYFGRQELSFTVHTDEFGHEQVQVHDTSEAMLAQVRPYLDEIGNAVLLCSQLTKYMEHANSYFYEQFFAIFDILAQFSEASDEIVHWRKILGYMQSTLTGRRRHRPAQAELEAWMRVHPDGDMLPEIAKFRYPFWLFVRQPLKSLLKDDITIENYRKLLVLVHMKALLEGLDPNEMNDYFCRSTVVNSINEYKIQHKELFQQSEWNRQTKNKAFLQAILRIVDSVIDRSSKLHILYYIACNALDGDDQVKAAHTCYKFARNYEQELSNIPEAKDKMEKIYRKYPVLRTQQLLQQNGVTDEKQFQLVKQPQELIRALYSDSCFQKVKVNDLAADIGKLHNLDVEAIQVALLQKWLTMFGGPGLGDGFEEMMEETLYDDHNVSDQSQEDETNVHECMARAYYILSSWERSKSVEFLVAQLNSSVDASTGSSDIGKQLQIYQCFSKLANDNCTSYQEFFTQNRYVALRCVHLLKSLGMHHLSIGKFESADKMALLKMLWQSHATNPKGLEALSLICIGYGIYVPQVWNGILKQMARLGLVSNLRALIDVVSAQRQLFGLEGYRMAWEILIKEPFRSANREQSLTEDTMLARSLVMLQKCPISFRLNLLEVADVCINVNRVNMGAVLIGFATDEQKEALKKLIANLTAPNLIEQIRELEEFGLVTTITKAVCRELKLNESSPPTKRWR